MGYSIAVYVHILAAMVLLGASFFALFTHRAIRRAPDNDALLGWLDFARQTARANPVAALALLVTGLYLGSVGWWSEAWFFVAIASWVVNSAWAARTIHTLARRTAAAAARPGPISEEAARLRRSRRWDVAADVLFASDLGVLYLMIVKPGWLGSIATVLVANGLFLAVRAWCWRQARAESPSIHVAIVEVPQGTALGVLALLAPLLLGGCDRREAHAETEHAQVARGQYLVNVLGCHDCHTPLKLGPHGPAPDPERALSGHPQDLEMPAPPDVGHGPWAWVGAATNTAFHGPWGTSYATNLTPDRKTGMGYWTEKMFVDALKLNRHMGISRPILPPMPQPAYSHATVEDLHAIYAYLRTVPPISNQVPDPQPPAAR